MAAPKAALRRVRPIRAKRSCAPPPVSSRRSISSEERRISVIDEKERVVPDILGILPLRGTVLFPHAVVPLGAGRTSSVRLIEEAAASGRLIGAVLQHDASDDAPTREGLHDVGTLTVIHKVLKQPDGTLRL